MWSFVRLTGPLGSLGAGNAAAPWTLGARRAAGGGRPPVAGDSGWAGGREGAGRPGRAGALAAPGPAGVVARAPAPGRGAGGGHRRAGADAQRVARRDRAA